MRNKTLYIFALVVPLFFSCKMQNSEQKQKYRITQEDLINVNRKLVGKDAEEINRYIHKHHMDMKETNTGLWYMIDKEGEGPMVKKGDVVKIAYEISLLDGTKCYSSDSLGLKEFKVGQGGVESGLEEGILFLNMGAKATFILPPHRAYGLVGDDNKIPGRSILLYKVELVDKSR